jgi:hypothetical protein
MDQPEAGTDAAVSEQSPGGGIDVDRLMDDLKRRAEARRIAGEVDPAVLDLPFTTEGEADAAGGVRLRLESAYSSKPGVGRVITYGKRTLIRAQYHFLNDLVGQINSALRRIEHQRREEERARRRLEDQVGRMEAELAELRERIAASVEPEDGDRPT